MEHAAPNGEQLMARIWDQMEAMTRQMQHLAEQNRRLEQELKEQSEGLPEFAQPDEPVAENQVWQGLTPPANANVGLNVQVKLSAPPDFHPRKISVSNWLFCLRSYFEATHV